MAPEDWDSGFGRSIGMFLNGQGIRENDSRGRPVTDVNFLVYFNSGDEPVDLVIPDERHGAQWRIAIDTTGELAHEKPLAPGESVPLDGRATLVLQEIDGMPVETDDSVDASLRAQTGQAAS
jgi:glycogen operon protein